MLIDLIRSKKNIGIDRETKIAAVKAVTWRILGTIDTIIISYFLTGKIKIALTIGSFEVFSKMFLYFIHEKLWTKWTK